MTPADYAQVRHRLVVEAHQRGGGFIVALLAGILVANVFTGFAAWLGEAVRPELYIKIAIVILGGFVAVTIAGKASLAGSILLRGLAAIVEAYLIYWSVVYFIARKWFGLKREWAAPLASGISICGVAASIATGSAIRARPAVPILVSSLVVVFAVVEVLVSCRSWPNNSCGVTRLWQRRGSVSRSRRTAPPWPVGGITEALIMAKAAAAGIKYQPGWILSTTAAIKVFIDVFIGVWAFILAYIWTNHHQCRGGRRDGTVRRDLGAVSEVHSRLSADLRRRAGHRQHGDAGDDRQAHPVDRRGELPSG